ncbi:MAG: glutathionylspermidine synthase family protein [Hyphomicrobiaceae bacterium]|nr:glutathionylspermidine synthase family protein [Hyphomicrobiaceae bacterium]
MQRRSIAPRPDWQSTAEAHGFDFHSPDGTVYWDEAHCYTFTLDEAERGLEAPAADVEAMCLDIVARAVRDEAILDRLGIPTAFHDYVAGSWQRRERNLYGRMDFCFDGKGPAKLYEYNADTPTSLYESAVFQWVWLEQMRERGHLPPDSDQLNSLHERLVDAFRRLGIRGGIHLTAVGASREDMGTVTYLQDCAIQAGLETVRLPIEQIGIDTRGRFTDRDDRVITTLFKLYPWEWLLREAFARHIPASGCRMIEPAWKSVLSNKGLMALLWEAFPGHPNLLPTYFDGDPRAADLGHSYVRKPLYSREGANIEIISAGCTASASSGTPGPYGAEGHVLQAYHPLPGFAGRRPVCGVWLVASEPAALGVREGDADVTTDAARFVPHVILG